MKVPQQPFQKENTGQEVLCRLLVLELAMPFRGDIKREDGFFTAAEVVAIGGWLTFSVLTAKDAVETKTFSFGKGGLALAFSLAFGGIKIWEVVDAFVLPDHYKVVKASPFQISPLVLWNNNSTDDVDWGLSLKYKF